MASIANDPNGHRRILFVDPQGERKAIRLGKASQRTAESLKYRVEQLLEAAQFGRPMENDLIEWVKNLEPKLAKKLANVGLIAAPEAKQVSALGAFLDEFMERRIDVKPATKEVWSQVVRNLKTHFGEDCDLATITEADAEDFKMYLVGQKLASTTIHKRLQFARMFFRSAKKRKIVPENPFAEVSAKAVLRQDRHHFITQEETGRLLAAANPTWRTIIALARYGGLRCPSEVLLLRWDDVNWETGRITVQSPKTAHHEGKGSRVIPLFPELRAILGEAHLLAPDGAEFVVGSEHRQAAKGASGWRGVNLRTHLERIMRRAGVKPWPRLFHAMRASRETKLAKDHPIHVVTAWLGNTPRIALKHYLQVTDSDFAKASEDSGAENGAQVAQNRAQQARAEKCDESHKVGLSAPRDTSYATLCESQLIAAKGLSGEDRIRTCGTV